MSAQHWMVAQWRVMPGREAEFVSAWERLSAVFASLPAVPLWGVLLQSDTDPLVYYSLGPWRTADDLEAMRGHPGAQRAVAEVQELCTEITRGRCHLVRDHPYRPESRSP